MAKPIQYTCSCCGEVHESWPALAYNSPSNYHDLSAEEKQAIAELNEDFCTIRHPDQTDRFIRATLTQKVIGHDEPLEYGIWVSLSEKSFTDYSENFGNENHEAQYFGWLCNHLPQYEFKGSIPTTVVTRPNKQRPEVFPHKSFDHPFVHDYYNGITIAEAERRIHAMLQTVHEMAKKKPWWKVW